MKTTKCRILAWLLLLLMTVPLFTACGTQDGGKDTTAGTGEGEETLPESGTEPAWAQVPDDVTYDGEDFTILVSGNVTYHDFTYDTTEMVLDQAIQRRNEKINHYFDIYLVTNEIFEFGTSYGAGPGYNEMMRDYASGGGMYDLAMIGTHDVSALAVQGRLSDLNSLPYIDLTNRWWDQKANEQLSMKGIMFYTTGALSTIVDQFTFCILFNKNVAKEKNVEDLYTLVKNGGWTLDKWRIITMNITEDLNGDDKYDEKDLYGSLVWNDTTLGVINAAGESIAKLNSDGEVELSLYNERTNKMMTDYLEVAYSKCCFNFQATDDEVHSITRRQMFEDGRALFSLYNVGDDNQAFRNSETLDYGFLPYFKLDENQEEYACHIQEGACYFACVPAFVASEEKTGMVTEALAAESYFTIRPAYFEKQLVGMYIRDDESEDMLNIIFSTRIFDVGAFYQVGGYTRSMMSFFLTKKTDFTSYCDKYKGTALVNIAEINDSIKSAVLN